ncbi:hypothetical protein BaRGS_00008421, partial [Batillaria attramentaria]
RQYKKSSAKNKMNRPVLTLLLWCILVTWPAARAVPEVQLGSGKLLGLETQVGNKTVFKFLGIRFAESPTGDRRFSKPQASPLPNTTVNASSMAPACPAVITFLPADNEDEDCLFLNVFVPSISAGGRLPVMVWIYGGAFSAGNANAYDAEVLAADGDVIVVTFNYRLGPFGFLSTGDSASMGNYGLWDQNLALKWVQANIRHFGGDDTSITLIGESAGAASVSYHAISPHSAGLFHRVIQQSGTYLAPWARVMSPPRDAAVRLARMVNCTHASDTLVDTRIMVDCLRRQPVSAIVSACGQLFTDNVMTDMLDYLWLPVQDDDFVPQPDHVRKFPGPIMLGLNNHEGGYFIFEVLKVAGVHPDIWTKIYRRDFYRDHYLPFMIQTVYTDTTSNDTSQSMEDAVRLLDCAYRTPGSNETHVTQAELEDVYGDQEFYVSTTQYLLGEPSTDNVYLYYFDHYPHAQGGETGMNHAADLPFTFGFTGQLGAANGFPENVSDVDLTNPNQPVPLWTSVTWPPYTKGDQYYLVVSPSPGVTSRLRADKMAVWLTGVSSLLQTGQVDNTEWNTCLGHTSRGSHEMTLSFAGFSVLLLLQVVWGRLN